MILRPYQEAAKNAIYWHLRTKDSNPCAVLPTGAGKTPLIASVCHDAVFKWNGRVCLLAHVKELLQQAADKLKKTCPTLKIGVHSAGLKRRDTEHSVIVAGIQSAYRKACDLGHFDLIIVDEAHCIAPEGDTMYRQFLADAKVINPLVRIIGLTATPFRMKSGTICNPDGFLNEICYEVSVKELIRDGYLCPLVSKQAKERADTSHLHIRAGEFVQSELENLMDQDAMVLSACKEIVDHTQDRCTCLIFAAGVRHAYHIASVLRERHGADCSVVTGATPADERQATLDRFRDGSLKYLVNINVLTTGFDATGIDCVAMVRPTKSPGLYYQMVGRGLRLHQGKQDCLVLDFGDNVLRHGPVDELTVPDKKKESSSKAVAKACPECNSLVSAGYAKCPICGFSFSIERQHEHDGQASTENVLSSPVTSTTYKVQDVIYSVHHKRNAPEGAPRSMRVDYKVGFNEYQSEWVCFEHEGYAGLKAAQWWRKRSPDAVPNNVEHAVELANAGALAHTDSITVRRMTGDKFDRITGYKLGHLPEPILASADVSLEELPF